MYYSKFIYPIPIPIPIAVTIAINSNSLFFSLLFIAIKFIIKCNLIIF